MSRSGLSSLDTTCYNLEDLIQEMRNNGYSHIKFMKRRKRSLKRLFLNFASIRFFSNGEWKKDCELAPLANGAINAITFNGRPLKTCINEAGGKLGNGWVHYFANKEKPTIDTRAGVVMSLDELEKLTTDLFQDDHSTLTHELLDRDGNIIVEEKKPDPLDKFQDEEYQLELQAHNERENLLSIIETICFFDANRLYQSDIPQNIDALPDDIDANDIPPNIDALPDDIKAAFTYIFAVAEIIKEYEENPGIVLDMLVSAVPSIIEEINNNRELQQNRNNTQAFIYTRASNSRFFPLKCLEHPNSLFAKRDACIAARGEVITGSDSSSSSACASHPTDTTEANNSDSTAEYK